VDLYHGQTICVCVGAGAIIGGGAGWKKGGACPSVARVLALCWIGVVGQSGSYCLISAVVQCTDFSKVGRSRFLGFCFPLFLLGCCDCLYCIFPLRSCVPSAFSSVKSTTSCGCVSCWFCERAFGNGEDTDSVARLPVKFFWRLLFLFLLLIVLTSSLVFC